MSRQTLWKIAQRRSDKGAQRVVYIVEEGDIVTGWWSFRQQSEGELLVVDSLTRASPHLSVAADPITGGQEQCLLTV